MNPALRPSPLLLGCTAALPLTLAAIALGLVEVGRLDAAETLETMLGLGLAGLAVLEAHLLPARSHGRRAWYCAAALLCAVALDDLLDVVAGRIVPAAPAGVAMALVCTGCGLALAYGFRTRMIAGARGLLLLAGFVFQAVSIVSTLLQGEGAAPHLPWGIGGAELLEPLEQLSLGCYLLGIVGVLRRTSLELATAHVDVRQMPPLLQRLADRLGHFAHGSIGRRLRIAVENLRLARWRSAHPEASFASYYAGTIERTLRSGQPHRTLGLLHWRRNAPAEAGEAWDPASFRRRGLDLFERLRREGIRPSDRCIDFGCGSLRLGQHLIRYLDPRCYIGIDVTSYFFTAGREMLEPEIVAGKEPLLTLITDAVIDALARRPADWIISTSVLMHVPPAELAGFFDRICRLAGPDSRLIVTFDCADQVLRTAPKAWAYPADLVVMQICARLSGHVCVVTGEAEVGRIGRTAWRRAMAIARPAQAFHRP